MSHDLFRTIVFLSVLALMYLLESLWSERPWETPRWKRLAVHSSLTVINTALLRLFAIGPLLLLIQWVSQAGWGLTHALGLFGAKEILVTFVLYDCYDYWWHRFNHRLPLLWRFHSVHHLDTHCDVTTALRFHPGELFFSAAAKALFILVWGPSLWAFVLSEMGITAFSQLHHSNVDLPDPYEEKMRFAYITPRIHASHHTVSFRTRNANFGTIFSVWDRIFGTFQEPDKEEMTQLGLPVGCHSHLAILHLMKAPFVRKQTSE